MAQEKDLNFVRRQLRKAAKIQDPRDMWYAVRDILNLLTIMLNPAATVLAGEELARAETMQG